MKKDEIRRNMLKKRDALIKQEVDLDSGKVCRKLAGLDLVMEKMCIVGYMPIRNEINLLELLKLMLKQGKEVYFPKYDIHKKKYVFARVFDLLKDMLPGKFGILEPKQGLKIIELEEIKKKADLWLVPGVAFDVYGHRVGFGKGFYDEFLKDVKGTKIGVCYPWQMVEEIDAEEHDMVMDLIVY